MSPEGPAPPPIERGQMWRERNTSRLVAITALEARVVSVLDPERGRDEVVTEPRFRARFEFTGSALREPDPDALPGAIDAATLRRLERCATSWLRGLVAVAEQRGVAELARLARQVLALRGEILG